VSFFQMILGPFVHYWGFLTQPYLPDIFLSIERYILDGFTMVGIPCQIFFLMTVFSKEFSFKMELILRPYIHHTFQIFFSQSRDISWMFSFWWGSLVKFFSGWLFFQLFLTCLNGHLDSLHSPHLPDILFSIGKCILDVLFRLGSLVSFSVSF
jgi:hypothetical protein